MNMIRKILITLCLVFTFAGSAFAYGNPRWFNIPVSVYIPKVKENSVTIKAFNEWQMASGGYVRFIYRNASNFANLTDISINFTPTLNNSEGYIVKILYPPFGETSGIFYKARVTVATSDSEGNPLKEDALKRRIILAAGRAIGVYNANLTTSGKISQESINTLHWLYKPGYSVKEKE